MELILNVEHFRSLIESGYSLDGVYLLKVAESGWDISSLREGNRKVDMIVNTLVRKGLLTDGCDITPEGKTLLESLKSNVEDFKLSKKLVADDAFDRWWKAYPGTDTFVHKGKSFSGSRSMRVRKDDCRAKMHKIINEGEYTMDDMIAALELDVLQKKDNSVKTGTNKLSYMQNSLTYLNQRSFEPFIELVKTQPENEEFTGATDI